MKSGARPLDEPTVRAITVEHPAPRRHLFRRRNNRRITVARQSIVDWFRADWLGGPLRALGRKLLVIGKALVVVALVAAAGWGGRQLVRHVIASPRFAVRTIDVGPTARVGADEIRALSGVRTGDRLLAVDPDAVAARLTTHPWILSARVRRQLPSTLAIEVTERRAVATALLGALYLLDDAGRPFKRATFAEADGLPVITGVTRDQYAAVRGTSEAVFRQALELFHTYGDNHPERPKLSEVHVDTRAGFTLVLFDGSGEVRLGRGDFAAKLARFDRIFAALGPRGPGALRTVYLDGPLSDRVTVRMAGAPVDPETPPAGRAGAVTLAVAGEKAHAARRAAPPTPVKHAAPSLASAPAADED